MHPGLFLCTTLRFRAFVFLFYFFMLDVFTPSRKSALRACGFIHCLYSEIRSSMFCFRCYQSLIYFGMRLSYSVDISLDFFWSSDFSVALLVLISCIVSALVFIARTILGV